MLTPLRSSFSRGPGWPNLWRIPLKNKGEKVREITTNDSAKTIGIISGGQLGSDDGRQLSTWGTGYRTGSAADCQLCGDHRVADPAMDTLISWRISRDVLTYEFSRGRRWS